MRYGLSLPTGGECGDPRFLLELGELAEASGWDGLFLEDYVCYQGDPAAPTCPTWPALAALAVRTSRMLLGSAVTPLARRRPWNLAREVATVDVLSGGRAVLGVGLGDTGGSIVEDSSFTRFGEERDERRRAELLDEGLEILAGLWSGEPFGFRGKHFTLEEVSFTPTPVQRPRVPIWVGGGYPNPRPTARALRWDGSLLYKETHGGPSAEMTPEDVAELRGRAGGRPFTIAVGGGRRWDDAAALAAHVRAVEAAGADWWVEWVPPAEREAMREAVRRGPVRGG